jgi:hypothetical protein
MPSDVYQDLAKFDRQVADLWRRRTHDNPDHRLTEADIDFILTPLLKGHAIGEGRATALYHLFQLKFTDDALGYFGALLQVADQRTELFRNGGDPLMTTEELKPVNNALGMAVVSKITFKSPGTGLSYSPSSYRAIQELIAQSRIIVLQINTGGLSKSLSNIGVYESNSNWLCVYDSGTPVQKTVAIVHESTHAFQDWSDVRAKVKFIEADAYVAGGVADRVVGPGTPCMEVPTYQAGYKAAEFVIAGEAVPGNRAWIGAYNEVVAAVSQSPNYAQKKDTFFPTVEPREGRGESKKLGEILKDIEKRQKDPAGVAK